MANYRKHDRQQIEMKLMCINDFVPSDHQARRIVLMVNEFDLTAFDNYYNNDLSGKPAYPLKSLICILIYSFFEGIYSTRVIEKYCNDNIVYRFLCCDDPPDHSTISRFWKRFKEEIEQLLVQTVFIGEEEDLIDFKHISGDGVKIKSMSSRSKIIDENSAKKRLENVEKRIAELINEIDKTQINEERQELEEKLEKQEKVKDKIAKGIKDLKILKEEVESERESGIKKENLKHINLNENEARLMKKKNMGYISGYNGQALVDSKSQMIIVSDVSSNCSDNYLGTALLEQVKTFVNEEELKESEISFDNGYFDVDFLKYCDSNKLDLYIDTSSVKAAYLESINLPKKNSKEMVYDENEDVYYCRAGERLTRKRVSYDKNKAKIVYEKLGCTSKCKFYNECISDKKRNRKRKTVRCPSLDKSDYPVSDREKYFKQMVDKMETEDAKKKYKMRMRTVEPVFAQIEENKSFRRFHVWGLSKAKGQWAFISCVQNIQKIINHRNQVAKAA